MALKWNRATRCWICGDPEQSAAGLVSRVVDEKNVLLCLRCSRVQKCGGGVTFGERHIEEKIKGR